MSEALLPTNEALAIIKAGTPKPQTPLLAPAVPTENTEQPKPAADKKQPVIKTVEATAKPVAAKEPIQQTPGLVSVGFRLPSDIPPALVKASADRKTKRVRPFTQQEIVAEALRTWLHKNGYSA